MKQLFTHMRFGLIVLCSTGLSLPLFAQFSGSGSGTEEDPYRIFNAVQLNQVRNFLNKTDVHFSLEADIDMTEWIADNNPVQGWAPIGTRSAPFRGTFNGNGHTISNIWINRLETDDVGLFGRVKGDVNLSNIHLQNVNYVGNVNVGGLVGYVDANLTATAIADYDSPVRVYTCSVEIHQCTTTGVIKGDSCIGGTIGNLSVNTSAHSDIRNYKDYNKGAEAEAKATSSVVVEECLSSCHLFGNTNLGGIVGNVSSISNAFARSILSESQFSSSASASSKVEIIKCNASMCQIQGNEALGGIIGLFIKSSDEVSYSGGSASAGVSSKVNECYFGGELDGYMAVGGIVGKVDGDVSFPLKECFVTGAIVGDANIGGLLGVGSGNVSISSSYAQCHRVFGNSNVAGICHGGSINTTVAINEELRANSDLFRVGAKGGSNNLAWTLTSMILNGEKQPLPPDDAQNGTSTGLSTLKLQATYEGLDWDFNSVWDIQETESFPYFQFQTAPPHFTQVLKAGDTQLSGQCIEGGTVKVRVGDKTYTEPSTGNTWSMTVDALQGGDLVQVSVQAEGKMPSYVVYATVSLAGNGTQDDPYLIRSAHDLQAIGQMKTEAAAYYKLVEDIDLTEWIASNNDGKGWVPVGGNVSALFGHFDGGGHTVSGLWTDPSYEKGGLFAAWAAGSEVKNLKVETATGKSVSGKACAGGLVGSNAGLLTDCHVSGTVGIGTYTGGIAGENTGTITACRFAGEVSSNATQPHVGGIAGYNTGTIAECYVEGRVSSISSNARVGGIAGDHTAGAQLHDNYSAATVTALGTNAYGAGIVGYNNGEVARCYATGDVTGYSVAGVCGYNNGTEATLTGCVAANRQITATKTGLRLLGGYTGGQAPSVTDNYALKTMSVSVNGIPQQIYDDPLNATARTQDELWQKALYESMGWNMTDVWGIDEGEGYPYLRAFVVPVSAVTLDKSQAEVRAGESLQLVATVQPEDASKPVVLWSSDNTEIATVDSQGLVRAVKAGKANITTTSKENASLSASCEVTVLPKLAASVSLDRTELSVEIGKTDSLRATVLPEDAGNRTVRWTSKNTDVAIVDANGKVTGVAVGTAVIIATTNDGTELTASCTVTVISKKAVSVTLDRESLSLEVDASQRLNATVLPEDAGNRSVRWNSEDESIATVSAEGIVIARRVGSTRIVATTQDGTDLSASCELTVVPKKAVSVSLNKESLLLELEQDERLVATVLPADAGNRSVVWASSNEKTARVNSEGVVTATGVGTATITATTNDGTNLSASCEVTVIPKKVVSITLDRTELQLEIEKTTYLTATVLPVDAGDCSLTWTSNNTGAATVDASGKVTALAVGTAVITATTNDGTNLSASCIVTVTPKKAVSISLDKEKLSLELKEHGQLRATVLPEDAGNRSVRWNSEDESIAMVNTDGVVSAIGVGTTVITATTADGTNLSASCEVTVLPVLATGIQLNQTEMSLEMGKSGQLSATVSPSDVTSDAIRWYSDNERIAKVDEYGVVTAVSVGTTTVYAATTDGSGLTAACLVTITPKKAVSIALNKETLSLETGESERLAVNVLPIDAGDRSVVWTSNNTGVATVDASGKVTALMVGTAIVTATTQDGTNLTASCVVTVTPKRATSIVLNKRTLTLNVDESEQLMATIYPDDAEDHSVTWASSDNAVATVDMNGVVVALSGGNAIITATTNDGSNLSASCAITVNAPNGITSINERITVWSKPGEIVITGATVEESLSIHDLSGRTVYTGQEKTIEVRGGEVYFVKIRGLNYKVFVP